jgi:hypothetical protein
MRFEMRTLKRTICALAVVLMLVLGAGVEALAHDKRGKRHKQNQGRHLGWERGRRVGHHRRDDDNWRRRRRQARREWRDDRRDDRRDFRRQRRSSFFDSRREALLQQRIERARFWRNRRN